MKDFWKVTLKFSELELHPSLQAGIDRLGFSDCTPIQELTMPHVLEGRDIAGLAQTGTGKTAAFLLPLMERIVQARLNPDELNEEQKAVREKRMFPDWRSNQFVLVLVPTRELADQVYENSLKLVGDSGLKAVSIYGGVAYDKQKEGLRNNVEFVIATPGRLIDLYKENLVDMKQVRAIVFDEADRMFDMGFKDDMKFILQRVPKERQFLVFSATLNLDVMNTAYQFGANPVEVNVSRDSAKAENVEDKIFHVGADEKGSHLLSLLRLHKPRQTIVFSNFKMNVPRLSQFLNDNGVPAVGISSLLTQSQRTRVMEQFKGESDHNILVATDVAARGLDIKGVDMVVNYELPDDPENYVHRIGRTGRAGEKGIAFSLVSDRDVDALSRVEQYLKHKLDVGYLEDTDIIKDYKAMPSDRGSRGAPRGGEYKEGRSGSGGSGRGPGAGGRGERAAGGRGGRGTERSAGAGGDRAAGSTREGGRGRPRRERGAGAEGGETAGAAAAAGGPPSRPTIGARKPEGQAAAGGQPRREGAPRRGQRGGRAAEAGTPRAPGTGPVARGANGGGKGGRPDPSKKHAVGSGKGPQPKGGRPIPNSKSLGAKVSGFFKKLFGG